MNTNPALRAMPLLVSSSPTWLERIRSGSAVQQHVARAGPEGECPGGEAVPPERPPAGGSGPEGPTGRAAVFGCTEFASDLAAEGLPPESAPISFDLIGVTIDWLRERPSVASVEIKAKQYQEYKFPDATAVSATRLVYLPLVLGLLAVIGIGAGVWVIRRK